MTEQQMGLRVAVTGPTGEIGRALLRALDREPGVERVVGMARSPFDPTAEGYKKVEYVQGDILDRNAVDGLVKDADVVVHLAFIIFAEAEQSRPINLEGSRNVFEAALAAPVDRLVYTSSVAAYGFHEDNPDVLTEDVEPRGSDFHHYSRQKADVEALLQNLARTSSTDVFVFRPCIVAGPTALALVRQIPYVKLGEKLPAGVQRMLGGMPLLRPVIPDPGIPFQLVHEDDVAAALTLAVLGRGEPGAYNLAADGEIDLSELARALGWYSIPVPELTIDVLAEIVSRLPYLPASANWVNALKVPVIVATTRARTKLGWDPQHDALETLAETVAAARGQGLLMWRPGLEPGIPPA